MEVLATHHDVPVLIRQGAVLAAAFHPELTGVAVAAKTPGMFADQVLPGFPVSAETFKWNEYPVDQTLTVPDTAVGRTSATKRVEFGAVERDGSTVDHGLEDPVPQTDATANSDIDPEAIAAEMTSQLVTLAREIRTAALVFSPGTYLAAQRTVYDNADDKGWWDPAVDALAEIEEARDTMIVTPNTLTLGQKSWAALRRNPAMIKAARSMNSTGEGRLSIDEVREILEIETINVGKAVMNFAKPGQDAEIKRVWGGHASLTFTERVMKNAKVYTFGATARLGGKRAFRYFDEKVGLEGANVVRVGERVRELVIAQQAGWFFQNAGEAPA